MEQPKNKSDIHHGEFLICSILKQAAFPAQEKRLDALVLCTNEIFMYLEENLKLTPQSLSDKAVALDELEEIHQQVCAMRSGYISCMYLFLQVTLHL